EGSFLLQYVDPHRHEPLLVNLEAEKKEKLLQFLNYPEDSAGRIMSSHFFSMPSELTAKEGLEYLRQKAKEESIYYIYCVGENQQLTGVVSLRDLATKDPNTPLIEFAKKEMVTVDPAMP